MSTETMFTELMSTERAKSAFAQHRQVLQRREQLVMEAEMYQCFVFARPHAGREKRFKED
jgi:hypothetical protein